MQNQWFVKSFSQGQITIPKAFRKRLGLSKDFWLKLTLKNDKIIAEPTVMHSNRPKNYLKQISSMKTDWFDYEEWKKNRQEFEKHFTENSL